MKAAEVLSELFDSAYNYYELYTTDGSATGQKGGRVTAKAMQAVYDAAATQSINAVALYSDRDLSGLFFAVTMPNTSAGSCSRVEVGIESAWCENIEKWSDALIRVLGATSQIGKVIYGISELVYRKSSNMAQAWKLLYSLDSLGDDKEEALAGAWQEVGDIPSSVRAMPFGLILDADMWTSISQLQARATIDAMTSCRKIGNTYIVSSILLPYECATLRQNESLTKAGLLVDSQQIREYRAKWREWLERVPIVYREGD